MSTSITINFIEVQWKSFFYVIITKRLKPTLFFSLHFKVCFKFWALFGLAWLVMCWNSSIRINWNSWTSTQCCWPTPYQTQTWIHLWSLYSVYTRHYTKTVATVLCGWQRTCVRSCKHFTEPAQKLIHTSIYYRHGWPGSHWISFSEHKKPCLMRIDMDIVCTGMHLHVHVHLKRLLMGIFGQIGHTYKQSVTANQKERILQW